MAKQFTITHKGVVSLMVLADAGLRAGIEGFDLAIKNMCQEIDDEISERLETVLAGHQIREAARGDDGVRPARLDVIYLLYKIGSLSDSHYAAALEIRRFAEMCKNPDGVGAVDPTKPVIDASPWKWGVPASRQEFDGRLADRCGQWLKHLLALGPLRGKKVTMSAGELVRQIVIENVPLVEIDRKMRCRKGAARALLVKALEGFPA